MLTTVGSGVVFTAVGDGRATRMPFMCVWLRLTIMKLASRKNMISINGMISMRARFFGIGEETFIAKYQYDAPDMVNVIGIFTLETVPGLNFHRRNALTAELSRIGRSEEHTSELQSL